MNKLSAILKSGEAPLMGVYMRILALAYLAGTLFHFSRLFGYGEISWEEMSITLKTSEFFYAQFDAITAVGLWTRRPFGVLCFLVASISQLALYWGFPDLFGLSDQSLKIHQGIINFHISTIAIFFMIKMRQR